MSFSKKYIKILLCLMLFLFVTPSCFANSLHNLQDNIGTDKFAHAGVGYIITDQLERNANFSKLEAFATVAALAYIKEQYVDDHFDSGDITATLSGYMLYQVSF